MMPKFIDKSGIAHVKVISPGQGSSAYYKEGQLERDVGAFTGGLSFIDHPGKTEQKDRPERSLRDLVGPIVGTPVYHKEGKDGPGMYGAVKVAEHWKPFIEELGSTLGISLRAGGSAIFESIGGKRTKVAERFNPGAGFDFVTKAGRGGKMVPLLEAATVAADTAVDGWLGSAMFTESDEGRTDEERFLDYLEKGDTMPKNETEWQTALAAAEAKVVEFKKRVTELTAANAELTTNGARLAEAVGLRQAQDAIATALSKNTVLPDVTKVRITESISTSAPLVEGKLDVAKLAEMIETAVTTETEYIESLSPKPSITGMGGGPSEDTDGAKRLFDRKKKQYLNEGKSEEDATRMANTFTEGR